MLKIARTVLTYVRIIKLTIDKLTYFLVHCLIHCFDLRNTNECITHLQYLVASFSCLSLRSAIVSEALMLQ